MNAIRRTSKRAHDQIELGLELRDASELEVQLPFNIGEPLVTAQSDSVAGPCRTAPEAAGAASSCRCMVSFSDSRERMPEVGMPAVQNGTPERALG